MNNPQEQVFDSQASVLVTGAAGYVGRNLVRHLLRKGHRVTGLVRSSASARIVKDLGAMPQFGDMLDPRSLAAACEGQAFLIHAAADTAHGRPDPMQDRANIVGTRNVFTAAHDAGLSAAVHISTEAVLLTGEPLIGADETRPLPANPAGGYSRSKGEAERVALGFASDTFRVMAVRPRFVWGRDDTTALPQLAAAARSGKLAWINGGQYLTSTTHIDNLTSGVELALVKGQSGHCYFIADDEPQVFRAFVTALLAAHDVKAPSREIPSWLVKAAAQCGDALATMTGGRVQGPMTWQEYATLGVEVTVNTAKAQRDLGYVPVISVAEGLAAEARQA